MLSRPEILLQVAEIAVLTPRVSAYRLVSPHGERLPAWSAGAHLNFRLPSGRARCYSLCGDPANKAEYWVAVQREENGEGGSLEVAETFSRSVVVRADPPRNGFPLAENGQHHVLMSGGIGITPVIAMIHHLKRSKASYFVHVCARSLKEVAFRDIIQAEVAAGRAALHLDGNDPARRPDMAALVGTAAAGVHAYACGPAGFLKAFNRATESWPREQVHVESFTPEARQAEGDKPFSVTIASTGKTIQVSVGTTLLAALKADGHDIATSCRQGICGSCMVPYLDGEPDHRDQTLTDDERRDFLTVCCSRARSASLTLDL
ncbi:PDR/VanB family oxidoreductase [Aminobacter niigataensis]|uniref:PDR/VanB family oxidoreductase n=1 Tax=Aminobacter niigataensis TaxID=83265 RepID=UPI0022843E92|nr:PDR/VanB family oxidoreductase [Aminobacter niigataensis]CAI2936681.1 Flavodoxin reductases (ferredoxin-NADPH reductases) family 1; Vanillate O-demethylase oxidoreductase [Aminobacter niigataensis]